MSNKIAIVPFSSKQNNDRLFKDNKARDNCFEPYITLQKNLSKHYICHTYDLIQGDKDTQFIFFNTMIKPLLKAFWHNQLKSSVYMAIEPPVIDRLHKPRKLKTLTKIFGCILTWQDDIIDGKEICKLYIPHAQQQKVNIVPFCEKKLLTTIISYKKSNYIYELYSKRFNAVKFFDENLPGFEFYGVGWKPNKFKSYKGKAESKLNILKNFKFVLCYENQFGLNGLISEKILDCFLAKTVPIFEGADNVGNYFPKETYIDAREFKDNASLLLFLQGMPQHEYHNRIIAIEKFLSSKEFLKYSSTQFYETIYNVLLNISGNKEKASNFEFLKLLLYLFFHRSFLRMKNSLRLIFKSILCAS